MIDATKSNLKYRPFASISVGERKMTFEELQEANAQLREVLRDVMDEKMRLFNENLDLKNKLRERIRLGNRSKPDLPEAKTAAKIVEFRITAASLVSSRLIQALNEVFKLNRFRTDRDMVLRCSPEQFVRFLIIRDDCGANNAWKSLKAKIVNEELPRMVQRYDFTKD